MNLTKLFLRCISTPYQKVGVSNNYAVKRTRNTLYIFFEGSDGYVDWKNNLDFPAKPYKRMNKTVWFAHRGFLKEWKELEDVIHAYISNSSIQKIVIAGFSRGAGIALLCHEYVWFNRPDLRNAIRGYGFGCPRIIWGLCTKKIKERWKNFTVIRNDNDIITRLPPTLLGYTHVGKMLTIGKKGKYNKIQAHFPESYHAELLEYEKSKK